jgi:hypothetical protein
VKKIIALLLCLTAFSCASVNYMRVFIDRKYVIDVEKGVFKWETCLKRKLFSRKCKEWFTHELDFSKKETRELLKKSGFVLSVRDRL